MDDIASRTEEHERAMKATKRMKKRERERERENLVDDLGRKLLLDGEKYLQLAKANDFSMLVPMMKISQQLHPYLDSICQLLTRLRGFGFKVKAEDFRRSG